LRRFTGLRERLQPKGLDVYEKIREMLVLKE